MFESTYVEDGFCISVKMLGSGDPRSSRVWWAKFFRPTGYTEHEDDTGMTVSTLAEGKGV